MTRLAVPVVSPEGLSSKVNDHFAKSEYFAIIEDKKGKPRIVDFIKGAASEKASAGKVAGAGIDVVLAGRIGSCMISVFMDKGIKMYSGAAGTLLQAFKDYKAGKLAEVQPNPYQL
ncbi:MAG TPA: NifB/NifX family molybdenum-iron cluster-binding protein [Methanocella sp.]|uniref:NifB/NifX family molybdenum-iron cluster-binding protein n=1 Tax=Methanocella sp. TaxID=2052833 RepID=UPI002BBEA41D|nr:NifB/NifX family molybdenum-iron cluster-binding protein [Methanocella sp.]HTY90654.1 NifB/NifX family molybdenum-iron cluster-binding protein [Methanocella sp.]